MTKKSAKIIIGKLVEIPMTHLFVSLHRAENFLPQEISNTVILDHGKVKDTEPYPNRNLDQCIQAYAISELQLQLDASRS